MPINRMVERPILLGIVGDSAAGKSTLAAGIANILGSDRVAIMCTDDYHKYSRQERSELGISALAPEANYIDILTQHILMLRAGRPILKPIYNHNGGTLDAPEYFEPKGYIIIEGLLGYSNREMRNCYDVKIYLDPSEELRVKWKVQRDTKNRGYTKEKVMEALKKRVYDTEHYIRPQRTFADIVVRFYPPDTQQEETGARLDVQHMLRPTLPHPDLTPIHAVGGENGFHLELARDLDGKPVDVLEFHGDIEDQRAKDIENLLWELIPEAHHMRENVGMFEDESDRAAMSYPLALSQLFITYHIVKAAMGVHAI